MAQVFISYSSRDEVIASEILTQLEDCGLSCWISWRDVPVGENFAHIIPGTIRQCSVFILLLSKNSVKSDDVKRELIIATRKYDNKKLIIPLMLEDFNLPDEFDYHLANIQIRSYINNPQETIREVINQINKNYPILFTPTVSAQTINHLFSFANNTPLIRFQICNTGEIVEFEKSPVTLGRRGSLADYQLKNNLISRTHLKIEYRGPNKYAFRDLHSSNMTHLVNASDLFIRGDTIWCSAGQIINLGGSNGVTIKLLNNSNITNNE